MLSRPPLRIPSHRSNGKNFGAALLLIERILAEGTTLCAHFLSFSQLRLALARPPVLAYPRSWITDWRDRALAGPRKLALADELEGGKTGYLNERGAMSRPRRSPQWLLERRLIRASSRGRACFSRRPHRMVDPKGIEP